MPPNTAPSSIVVEAMLDLVKEESERIDSRFLEPACGSGNFLFRILQRKLAAVELNHRGPRCTFEAIIEDYHLQAPGLERLALIVRAADVKGQEQVAPEGIGLRAMAEGFDAMGLSDEEPA